MRDAVPSIGSQGDDDGYRHSFTVMKLGGHGTEGGRKAAVEKKAERLEVTTAIWAAMVLLDGTLRDDDGEAMQL